MRSGVALAAAPAMHRLRLANGVMVQYAEQGPQTGDAILMLHGLTDTWFSFSPVLPLMPASLRVIAMDLRGHGGSDRRATGHTMDDLAQDAIQLLDALSIPRATVVGHSMGSFVARRIAALAPERVSLLVLVGAGANARNPVLTELKLGIDGLEDPAVPAFAAEFQNSTVHTPLPAEFMERVIADSSRMPAALWKSLIAGMMDYRAAERDIKCPTLILGGDRDSVFSRAEQEELGRLIPGATVRIFTDIGHATHWENPEGVVRELTAFVKAAGAAPATNSTVS
jgi:pimeloyl-ACP methyl ester carboxylesterase